MFDPNNQAAQAATTEEVASNTEAAQGTQEEVKEEGDGVTGE